MPYFVTDKHPECSAWATVKEGGELVACHGSEQDAIDQMVAISVAEDIVPGGTYEGEFRQIDLTPPEFMREAARQGLRYYEQGLAGDGLTSRTVREARSMAAGEVSEDKWVRIAAWISRHLGDLDSPAADPESDDYPSAGVVAHLLWGSGPSKEAANRALAYATRIVLRIKNENEANMLDNSVMDTRAEIGELAVDDIVRWIVGDDVKFGQVASVSDTTVEVVVWDEEDGVWYATELTAVVDVAVLEKLDGLPEPEMDEEDMSSRSHNKFETRLNVTNFEIRETADGMLFEGYASVFNSRSENLGGFTEFVAPGAFTRSLKSRNDVKLLWNHDAGQVLGSTRAKTMSLVEDSRGLKVSATLPNTSLGRDTAELIRTGIIDSMSFGFNVIKDSWNAEGNERTLHSVRLFEVSIVAFPAYSSTAGTTNVRSVEKLAKRAEVDMAELEAALIKLESGQDLDEASRDLLNNVINKVSPSVTFEPEQEPTVVGDLGLLALKKKKLELLDL
jgi:HK97 family phage prohead protease